MPPHIVSTALFPSLVLRQLDVAVRFSKDAAKPGDEVDVEWRRGGETRTARVKLEERKR